MIVTLTPNPSLDRTIELAGPLARGDVQRAVAAHQEPGGKGVNICRALSASGVGSLAVLPGDAQDPVLVALRAQGFRFSACPSARRCAATSRSPNRTAPPPRSTSRARPRPGPAASAGRAGAGEAAAPAGWCWRARSPPASRPISTPMVTRELRHRYGAAAPKVAIDSSGAPLPPAVAAGPDLLKPNAEELAELTGGLGPPTALEADPHLAAEAAQTLVDAGVGAVLATLGSKGAVLVTADGAGWPSSPRSSPAAPSAPGTPPWPAILLADIAGESAADCLRQAAAHGAAAASLPGSTVPARSQTNPRRRHRDGPRHTSKGGCPVTTLITRGSSLSNRTWEPNRPPSSVTWPDSSSARPRHGGRGLFADALAREAEDRHRHPRRAWPSRTAAPRP